MDYRYCTSFCHELPCVILLYMLHCHELSVTLHCHELLCVSHLKSFPFGQHHHDSPSPPHRLFHRRHNLFLRTAWQISGKHLCYSRLLSWHICLNLCFYCICICFTVSSKHFLAYLFVFVFLLYLYLFLKTAWPISSKHLCFSLFASHLLESNKANDNHISVVQILLWSRGVFWWPVLWGHFLVNPPSFSLTGLTKLEM